jgi:putative transposase
MPGRLIPLRTGEYYHVFNRGIDRCPTFTCIKEYERAMLALHYYQYIDIPVRLSVLLSYAHDAREHVLNECDKRKNTMINVLAVCLMPNHFHLLLQQTKDGGISTYLGNFQNSYTRYFNTRNERDGSLFLDQFKAVHIETDEQLMHVSRYIHLNPFTSSICSEEEVFSYRWSSLSSYYGDGKMNWVNTSIIDKMFRSKNAYRVFVQNQAGYQKTLKMISYLTFE